MIYLFLVLINSFVLFYALFSGAQSQSSSPNIPVLGGGIIMWFIYVLCKRLSFDIRLIICDSEPRMSEMLFLPLLILMIGAAKFMKLAGLNALPPVGIVEVAFLIPLVVLMMDVRGSIRNAVGTSPYLDVSGGGWHEILYRQYPPKSISDLWGFFATILGLILYCLVW